MKHYLRSTIVMTLALSINLFLGSTPSRADIAIIVNPNNPVKTLTSHEVKKIFLGRARLFPGTGQAMAVLDQNRHTPIYEVFYKDLIGFGINKLKRYRAAYLFSGKGNLPQTMEDHQAVKEKILKDERAIGYIDAALVDDTVKVVYQWPEQQDGRLRSIAPEQRSSAIDEEPINNALKNRLEDSGQTLRSNSNALISSAFISYKPRSMTRASSALDHDD